MSLFDPPPYQELSSIHLVKLRLLRVPYWFLELSSSILLFAIWLHYSPTMCALIFLSSIIVTLCPEI
jgi:hypothetical protein